MQKILRTTLIGLFVLALFAPVAVFALAIDTQYVPLTDIPGISGIKGVASSNPGSILQGIFSLAIGIGGILAIIMIIFAGFKYMYQESIFEKSDAKAKITNAFFGLLLILGSYIILKTINGDLLRINLFLPQGDGKLAGLVAEQQNSYSSIVTSFTAAANKQIANLEKARVDAAVAAGVREETEKRLADLIKNGKGTSDEAKTLQAKLETDKKNESVTKQNVAIENQNRLLDQGLATQLKWLGTTSGDITAEEKDTNIKQMTATTNTQFDQSIENLKSAGVNTAFIAAAQKEKEFFNVVANQSIENENGLAVATSYISNGSKNDAIDLLVTRRSNMAASINETVASTRVLNPELADSFVKKGQDLLKNFDLRVGETVFPNKKCSSIRYHSDKTVECIP